VPALRRACPYCSIEIRIKELPYEGLFDNFRVCPGCGGRFTVDTYTKFIQAVFIAILFASLVLTVLLYYRGSGWLIAALASYVGLGLVVYWGNKNLYYVPYRKDSVARG
jgi:hypothetical protein